jgi:alpha-L-rhamnosidase
LLDGPSIEKGRIMTAPSCLRVEHLGDAALGIGDRRLRLSWRLPHGATRQEWYRIGIGSRERDRVESDQSVLVPWPAEDIGSRQRFEWRVQVGTDLGESGWSEPAWFETGLLDPEDWSARWVEPVEEERSAHLLRRSFHVPQVVETARMYATAHGIYEAFLNGRRVGNIELAPGFTSYETRLQVQVYDVRSILLPGANVWEVVLTDGWWRGRTGFSQRRDGYGTTLGFLGQLEVGDLVVATGPEWESGLGPVVSADLMAGQESDHRRSAQNWRPVVVRNDNLGSLVHSPAPPSRRVQEIRPVSVTRPAPDRQVVDLGQNINGWVRLTHLGPAGTSVSLLHGEALDPSGDVTQDNLGGIDFTTGEAISVGQTDRVVSAGNDGEAFEPRHTTHGFQYVRVEGHPGRLSPDDVTGVVVHTDLRRTGWFRCSDEGINRFHDIAEWSFRANACEIPTDCPQRERAGWTGDWQLFVPSAAFLYDVAGFSLKWLRDLAAEQMPDGCVTNYAPDPYRGSSYGEQFPIRHGSSGWGDAMVIVPWELWRAYGDEGVLAEMWPAMVAWVDFAAGVAREQRHASRVTVRPEPAPHERYVWDGGFHWGEWLEPGGLDMNFITADQGAVATAFLHRSAALLGRIGRVLGRDSEADRFEELAAKVLDAWQKEFIYQDGSLTVDTQANHVRALAFGLVPDDLRDRAASRLVELIRKTDTHLGTGFLATPYLLPVLADTGHPDVAYQLLFQNTPPSWLYMIEQGATTVWESWEGRQPEGATASLNHYSKGAVISFLHRYVAGVRSLDDHPGYRRFRVQPLIGGGLTWADAVHDSPYGRIESSWRTGGDKGVELTVTVPASSAAEVQLPDGRLLEQKAGTSTYRFQL